MIPELFGQLLQAGVFDNKQKAMKLLTGNMVADIISQQNLDDLSNTFGAQYRQGTRTQSIAKGLGLDPDDSGGVLSAITEASAGGVGAVGMLWNMGRGSKWLLEKGYSLISGDKDDPSSVIRDGDMKTSSVESGTKHLEEAYKIRGEGAVAADFYTQTLNAIWLGNFQTKAVPNKEVFGENGPITDELQGITVYFEQLKELQSKDVHKKVAQKMMSETGWAGGKERQENVLGIVDEFQKEIFDAFKRSDSVRELMQESSDRWDALETKYSGEKGLKARDLFDNYYGNLLQLEGEKDGQGYHSKNTNKRAAWDDNNLKEKIQERLKLLSSQGNPEDIEDFNLAMQVLSRINNHMGSGMASNFRNVAGSSKYNNIEEYRKYINDENMDPGDIGKEMKAVRSQHKHAADMAEEFAAINDTLIGNYSVDMDEYGTFMSTLAETIDVYGSRSMMDNPEDALDQMARVRDRLVEDTAEGSGGKIARILRDNYGISFGSDEYLESLDLVAPTRETLYDYYHNMRRLAEDTEPGQSIPMPDASAPWHDMVQRMALATVIKNRSTRIAYSSVPATEAVGSQLGAIADLQDSLDTSFYQQKMWKEGPEAVLEEIGGEVED